MAFIITLVCVFGSFGSIFLGYNLTGVGLFFISIATLIGIFIGGKRQAKSQ